MTEQTKQRDHGGNLDQAMNAFGGARADWVDLSTGINPEPYPVPALSAEAWAALPRAAEMAALRQAAAAAYDTRVQVLPFAGAQGVIQSVPYLARSVTARVISPTYNEHAAALSAAGWQVEEVSDLSALHGANLAVVVNPNNPDGTRYAPEALIDLSKQVGYLIVDESFVDPEPELSLAPRLSEGPSNIIVLRSFGKFYGLAGLRLGFALASGHAAQALSAHAGPWPVSGPAIEIARKALADQSWAKQTVARLAQDCTRLDTAAKAAGWALVGGTPLFRTYETSDAEQVQTALARAHVWSRRFPYSKTWIRLGLPPQDRWEQVERAIAATR